MERVMIIGCGGAGKSTLARQLGEKTGLPVVHLDQIYWSPGNWQHLEKEEFKHLFSKQSQAEVPVVGVLNEEVISGQIDRLVVTDDSVLIIDFKSGKHVPSTQENVPIKYQKQMQTYKLLLQKIFPDKVVRTFLLWTDNLTLMELV